MTYKYEDEKPRLFTGEGQFALESMRQAIAMQMGSPPFSMGNSLLFGGHGEDDLLRLQYACVDFLVELGEIEEVFGDEPPESPYLRRFRRPYRSTHGVLPTMPEYMKRERRQYAPVSPDWRGFNHS